MEFRDFPPLPFVIRLSRWVLVTSLVALLGFASAIAYVLFIEATHPLDALGMTVGYAFLTIFVITLPLSVYECITRPAQLIFWESGIEQVPTRWWPGKAPVFIRWEDIGGLTTTSANGPSLLHVHRKDGHSVMTIFPMKLGMRSSRMRALILHYRRFVGGIPPDWISPGTEADKRRTMRVLLVAIAVLLVLFFFLRSRGLA